MNVACILPGRRALGHGRDEVAAKGGCDQALKLCKRFMAPAQLPSRTSGRVRRHSSMAASMVTGAVALLSAYNPQAPGWLVKQSILSSVDVHPTLVGTTLTGGRLNLFGAMQAITPDGFLAAGGSGTPPVFSTKSSIVLISLGSAGSVATSNT